MEHLCRNARYDSNRRYNKEHILRLEYSLFGRVGQQRNSTNAIEPPRRVMLAYFILVFLLSAHAFAHGTSTCDQCWAVEGWLAVVMHISRGVGKGQKYVAECDHGARISIFLNGAF